MGTNNSIESPEEFFSFDFGYDVVKNSKQIIQKFPSGSFQRSLLARELLSRKQKDRCQVSVRSIVAGVESIKG